MLNFSQSLYVVDEDDGVVPLELILSNPSSSNFTVSIITNNITASSKKQCFYIISKIIIIYAYRRERL